jgi:penicillin-binding protein 1C
LVEALLFKEDRHFRYHWGVNPISIFRAAFKTYGLGGRRIGGSTISMQVARLLSQSTSKTIFGKLKQIGQAVWLETLYSKDEILETYLNLLPYGSNVEGVGTASLIYFNKKPARLNMPEIFTLAVIPQSPRLRSVGKRGELASSPQLLKARDQLLDLYADEFAVSSQDRLNFKLPFRMKGTRDLPFLAPHFVEDVLANNLTLNKEILTTLNRKSQEMLESKITHYVERNNYIGVYNATALLVDWNSLEIKASVGSKNYFDDEISGQVNGTKAFRSPGSTLKPFAYALAMDQGLIHNQSLLKDAPATYAGFDPENFDRDFQGPLTAEQALIRSRNLPAVQLVSELKSPSFYDFLKQNKIQNMKSPEFYGLSTILGGIELTMENLVEMYTMFPNSGAKRKLRKLKSDVATLEGSFFSPEASFAVMDILSKLPRPSVSGGSPWAKNNNEVYWKTGTSQGFRDAWTVGVVGQYVLAVWVGNFDGESNPAFIGKDIAAPLFFEIIDGLRSSGRLNTPVHLSDGLNIKKVKVCSLSGKMPGPHCKHTKETWFIPGKSPISTCDIHREINVDPTTGFRLCNQLGDVGKKQVFEFWPSDLAKIFRQAGLTRAAPPKWDRRCRINELATNGVAPKITSPKRDIIYSIQAVGNSRREIALSAMADADVRETYWFIDESYVGKTKPGEELFWMARSGEHSVRVVDDQGRSDNRALVVEVVSQ